MRTLVVFLNELSYACDGLSTEEIRPHVLTCLTILRELRRLRGDVAVAGEPAIHRIAFGGGIHTLGAVLNGNEYKEEWIQLKTWAQSSAESDRINHVRIKGSATLTVDGQESIGVLCAFLKNSLCVSIASSPAWTESEVRGTLAPAGGEDANQAVTVCNLSSPEHIGLHREFILNAGLAISPSSLVYEGYGFVIRMYFDDHDPPHIHVLERRDSAQSMAKIAIASRDTLEGRFPSGLERTVKLWTIKHETELLDNWHRLRQRAHPLQIRST